MTTRPRTVLIADDEPLALERLRRLVRAEPDYQIVGEAATGPELESLIQDLRPEVIILDILMPGADGLEVLRKMPPSSRPAVIFATAMVHRALDAFEVGAVDYLLKPFDAGRLRAALHRTRPGLRRSSMPPPREITGRRIALRSGNRWILMDTDRIDLVEASNQECTVTTSDGKTFRARELLGEFARRLPALRFLRISRFAVVQLEAVRSVAPKSHGDQILELRNGRHVAVSRTHRQELLRRLHQRG